METQQKIWMMQFGVLPIPRDWYKSRKENVDSIAPKAIRVRSNTCIKKAVRKLKKAIYVLLDNYDVKTRDEVYEILKERGFLPVLTHPTQQDRHMSKTRFYYYYTEVSSIRKITKKRETKTDFIEKNYKTMSVLAIADHIGSKELYVQQTISRIKREAGG